MSVELVFATSNTHKLQEVQFMMGDKFMIKSLHDIGCNDDIAETGKTFHENATLKSTYIYQHFGLHCFADDSGLEIDALGGEPGVFSARYSGLRNDEENLQLVLNKMTGIECRNARFKCVISLLLDGIEHFFEGAVEGTILTEKTGDSGFGYDPIFMPDGYSKSFADMPSKVKNSISHRGRAVSKMLDFFNNI